MWDTLLGEWGSELCSLCKTGYYETTKTTSQKEAKKKKKKATKGQTQEPGDPLLILTQAPALGWPDLGETVAPQRTAWQTLPAAGN